MERADRWGGWAPIFFGLGLALTQYEQKADAENDANRQFDSASR